MLRYIEHNEPLTILLVAGLIFIALAKLLAPGRFLDFINLLFKPKYLKVYRKDQKFLDLFEALLFANLVVCTAVFFYIIYEYGVGTRTVYPDILIKIGVGIGVFIVAKVLIERLVGSLFEIDDLMDNYLFQKISYKNFLGLVLLPFNALLLYTLDVSEALIYSFLGILVLVNFTGLISTIKTNQSIIKQHLFYFILYLCALEIAPYLVLYKVFVP
ncbi:DUF4271 domain-containing protein [Gaetbulibacter aestuarii]|uniref:DUF4271 domain-containing protein n=1 Tax=Gaetbulibacter aestuarii TaxID=1502358 RepID=A0ABW7MWD4_9FLAO